MSANPEPHEPPSKLRSSRREEAQIKFAWQGAIRQSGPDLPARRHAFVWFVYFVVKNLRALASWR